MDQNDKAYYLKDLELALFLALKGMKELYGFRMKNIQNPKLELIYQTIFELKKENLLSVQNLVNYLKSNGEKTTFQTIDNYLYALQQALILLRATQAGLQGKKLLRPLQKFYVVDTGLRNLSIRFALRDVGYQLESIVYVELLRRGFSVSVGSLNSSEIDFVASRNDETLYIQVCENMGDDSVLERELAPLRNVHDGFPKVILTLDRLHIGVTSDGIKVKSLIEWLLEV